MNQNDLPPGYESLNDEQIAEAKRHDEGCRGVIAERARAKEAENWQRDQELVRFEERYLRRQVER
jgi:hypothetical protein